MLASFFPSFLVTAYKGMGMASSITQVRVGMGREGKGDWVDDTNFDKFPMIVFLFPLQKKEKKKNWAWKCKEEGEGVTQEPLF